MDVATRIQGKDIVGEDGGDGFFFSSKRRHTRYWRDWSSDVCSSDLRCTTGGGADGCGPDPAWTWRGTCGRFSSCGKGASSSQIGRASWRERVQISVGAVSLKKKEPLNTRIS